MLKWSSTCSKETKNHYLPYCNDLTLSYYQIKILGFWSIVINVHPLKEVNIVPNHLGTIRIINEFKPFFGTPSIVIMVVVFYKSVTPHSYNKNYSNFFKFFVERDKHCIQSKDSLTIMRSNKNQNCKLFFQASSPLHHKLFPTWNSLSLKQATLPLLLFKGGGGSSNK